MTTPRKAAAKKAPPKVVPVNDLANPRVTAKPTPAQNAVLRKAGEFGYVMDKRTHAATIAGLLDRGLVYRDHVQVGPDLELVYRLTAKGKAKITHAPRRPRG